MTKHEAHTPEPWIFDGNNVRGDKQKNGHVSVATMLDIAWPHGRRAGRAGAEANARRIVACVNACAGIETYALELMTGELSILNQITATKAKQQKLTPKATQYRQQRDKLLAALVNLVNHPQDITTPAYQSALAAINECEK